MITIPIVITKENRTRAMSYFMSHIRASGNCWLWTGQIETEGYGRLHWPLDDPNKKILAHRFSYVLYRGVIPVHVEPDHICRNRSCVNPSHLELVTHQTNTRRGVGPTALNALKTHCLKGHKLCGSNLVPWVNSGRECRTCNKEYHRRYMRSYREKLRQNG